MMSLNSRSMMTGALMICGASISLGCGSSGGGDGTTAGAGGTSVAGSGAGGSGAGGASAHGGSSTGGESGSGTADDGCTGPVVAEWDIDGAHYKSSTSLFIDEGTAYTFNLVACRPRAATNDTVVEFGYFPSPIAAGSITLKDKLLSGMPGPLSGALYLDGNSGYKTDSTHMGTLDFTAVDMTAMTADGTFEFDSVGDDGTTTHAITNGVITQMKFQLLMP